jgi:hypothetical protein
MKETSRTKGDGMEYRYLAGEVHSRKAVTPPVINSELAHRYGVQVQSIVEPTAYTGFTQGQNVKLRLLVDGGSRRMTCHAQIDWIKRDESSGIHVVGFGHLSLTDEEFHVLQRNFAEGPTAALHFGVKVRELGLAAEPVAVSREAAEIMRFKAINFPISVIEEIDEHRGDVSFSEFVTMAVRDYVRHLTAPSGKGS